MLIRELVMLSLTALMSSAFVNFPMGQAGFVPGPNGGIVSSNCVSAVQSGSTILNATSVRYPDGEIYRLPMNCSESTSAYPPDVNGWVENSIHYDGSGYSYLQDNWNVPASPSNNNDPLIYLFDSLEESCRCNTIIQPVLAWGCAQYTLWWCSDGGHYWWFASWYVHSGGYVRSSVINVNSGDYLTGQIQWYSGGGGNGCSNGFYSITSQDNTKGQATNLSWCDSTLLPNAEPGVLEAYRLSSCNQLPNTSSITFSNLASTPSQNAWGTEIHVSSPSCGWALGAGPTATTLYWHN